MKILLTGAGGFLGRGMTPVLAQGNELRLVDVCPFESGHEVMVADIAQLTEAKKAVRGMDALVLSHMASRQSGAYESTEIPFDVNVKGTANLLQAAVEEGVKRVVLISSIGAVNAAAKELFRSRDLPLRGNDMYCLTKALQEIIAEHYHRVHGLQIAVIRPGWVVDADSLLTKYDSKVPGFTEDLIDRRDIGEAAVRCCRLPDLTYEIFYVSGPEEAKAKMDVEYTMQRLGWQPKHLFHNLPR